MADAPQKPYWRFTAWGSFLKGNEGHVSILKILQWYTINTVLENTQKYERCLQMRSNGYVQCQEQMLGTSSYQL